MSALAILAMLACRERTRSIVAMAIDQAAESYVRLVLALGDRDPDSLDSYHGPAAWRADAHAKHASLDEIRHLANALENELVGARPSSDEEDVRRAFLVRQLRAIVARIDILRGARPPFADEAFALFGVRVPAAADTTRLRSIRATLDRLLSGRGDLSARFMAFDRRFLVPAERLPLVLARAIERCRTATLPHAGLPMSERVDIEYVHNLSWSAFTHYEGRFRSRIQVNADSRLTVDRALDLACHEAYPGHHVIDSLIDARWGTRRAELDVRPLFSPQALLHEGAASLASSLAFDEAARIAFERDELFPLAGLVPAAVEEHVRITRLVDELRDAETDVARRYLDGELDFPRASAALARDALIASSDATLKFLNQYRTYTATYTLGRALVAAYLDSPTRRSDRWHAYVKLVTSPAQQVPRDARQE